MVLSEGAEAVSSGDVQGSEWLKESGCREFGRDVEDTNKVDAEKKS
jgi:hypothetical protein